MRRILQTKSCDGFTLVEVMIVLVIIGIIAAAAVPSMITYLDYSRVKTCESTAKALLAEAERYLVTVQFCERNDVDELIECILERNSAVEFAISADGEDSRSADIKTMSGERYSVSWNYNEEDNISDLTVVCSEHSIKMQKSFRLSYIGEVGYARPFVE